MNEQEKNEVKDFEDTSIFEGVMEFKAYGMNFRTERLGKDTGHKVFVKEYGAYILKCHVTGLANDTPRQIYHKYVAQMNEKNQRF